MPASSGGEYTASALLERLGRVLGDPHPALGVVGEPVAVGDLGLDVVDLADVDLRRRSRRCRSGHRKASTPAPKADRPKANDDHDRAVEELAAGDAERLLVGRHPGHRRLGHLDRRRRPRARARTAARSTSRPVDRCVALGQLDRAAVALGGLGGQHALGRPACRVARADANSRTPASDDEDRV